MTELSGFSAAQKLGPDLGPQSMRVPISRDEAVEKAAGITDAIFDALEAGLSKNIKAEFLMDPNTRRPYCRIDIQQPDDVRHEIANPGDWMAVDGLALRAMINSEYAGRFTQNVPLEWDNTVTAELLEDGRVKLTWPQPTSANRPFAYTVKDSEGQDLDTTPTETGGIVTAVLEAGLSTPGDSETFTVHVATQYQGVDGDSEPVSVPEPEPKPEFVEAGS